MTEIYYDTDDMKNWKECHGKPFGEDKSCSYSVAAYHFSIDNHRTYFDAQVGYMCEIMQGEIPSKVEKQTLELVSYPLSALICG